MTDSKIDELIREKNPFSGNFVVRPSQIWGKSFPDVASINAHASNAVFDAIEKIRKGQRETVGITITAERGLGKSHIISRIRHRIQAENGTLFIYMSKYDNLNQIQYQFLQTVASSLRAFTTQKIMQWQEIAAALINEVKHWNYTPQQYINGFPNWLIKSSNKVVNILTEIIIKSKPEITNPYIIKAILWTLSSAHSTYANYWLSGFELAPTQAEDMGLPNHKKEDIEAESLKFVRQILEITSDYKIPVICFDELDIADIADNGFTAAQIVASLAKDLYNNLKKGVLLLAMYPDTWNYQIRSLPQVEAVVDRLVSDQSDRQPIALKYLNSDDVVAVVHQWLQDFYEEYKQIPPHFLYPFNEAKLRTLGKTKPTVRSLLKWCADNFIPDNKHPVEAYFQQELAKLEGSID
jgi:glutaredoxin-related protein